MAMQVPLFTHTFCDRCRHSICKCLCVSQEYHRQVTSGEAIDDFVWLCTLSSSSLPEWWKVELWKYLYFSWCSFCLVTDFNCLNNPFNLFPLPCGKNKVFTWWQLSDPLVPSNVFQWRYTILTKYRCLRFSNYLSLPWLSTLRSHFGWLREGLYFRQYVTFILKYWISIKEVQLGCFCWRSPSISQLQYWPLFSLPWYQLVTCLLPLEWAIYMLQC